MMRKHLLWALIAVVCCAGAPLGAQSQSQADSKPAQNPTESPTRRVVADHPDLSQQVIKTVFLRHLSGPTEIQDVVNVLRTILEFNRVQPMAARHAIILRGTGDQVARAEALIRELDVPPTGTLGPPTYKLVFTLTETENGKKLNARDYAMLIERAGEHEDGKKMQFRVGSRVPVATSAVSPGGSTLVNTQFQYIDAGVNIDARLWGTDDDLTLDSNIEVSGMTSSVDIGGVKQPIVRQLKSNLLSSITAGKSTVIGSMDEADSPRQMEISVLATKLK